jgi:hypothetical protein
MNLISYLTITDFIIIGIVLVAYVLFYFRYQKAITRFNDLINQSIKENEHLYTPQVRDFIQKTIKECGVTAPITAISGWRAGKKEEALSFAIIPSKDGQFYVNIPLVWVSFLGDLLKKREADEKLLAEESQKLNAFIWVMHHEMNHVKKMMARKSAFSRSFPWKKAIFGMIIYTVLLIYIAHMELLNELFDLLSLAMKKGSYEIFFDIFFNVVVVSVLVSGSLGFAVMSYVAYIRCREEYACDSHGIESIPVLRGGVDWLMHDAKEYVDELFDSTLKFLRFLYKTFPNAICSLFTFHPHPIARAKRLEEKIAKLEARG